MKKMICLIALSVSLATFLSACTAPAMTKGEALQRKFDEHIKNQNYLKLARYWDINAEKKTLDFKGNSFLTLWESEGRAEITLGAGPYYGMIELIRLDEKRTKVVSYGWDYMKKDIDEWRALILAAPEE